MRTRRSQHNQSPSPQPIHTQSGDNSPVYDYDGTIHSPVKSHSNNNDESNHNTTPDVNTNNANTLQTNPHFTNNDTGNQIMIESANSDMIVDVELKATDSSQITLHVSPRSKKNGVADNIIDKQNVMMTVDSHQVDIVNTDCTMIESENNDVIHKSPDMKVESQVDINMPITLKHESQHSHSTTSSAPTKTESQHSISIDDEYILPIQQSQTESQTINNVFTMLLQPKPYAGNKRKSITRPVLL